MNDHTVVIETARPYAAAAEPGAPLLGHRSEAYVKKPTRRGFA